MRVSHILILGLAFLGAGLLNTWALPLFDLDEGAFAEATREMLSSGNYLMTYLNGELRSDKPILTYWLQSLSVGLLGQTEIAYRLPSILAGLLWMLAIYRFTWDLTKDRHAALFAAAGMILCIGPAMITKAATADALLNLFLALTLLTMYRYHQQPKSSTAWLVFIYLGLGALTKGPVALAIPFIVSFAFFAYTGRLKDWARALLNPIGWLLFLGIVGAWLVPLYLHDPATFADFFGGFIGTHNMQRFSEGLHGKGHWAFYFTVLPLILLPMTMLLGFFPRWISRFKAGEFECFTLIWFVLVFVLISASQTQFPHYGLYLATPMFVLFGVGYQRLPPKWLAILPSVLLLVVLAVAPWLVESILPPEKKAYDRAITEVSLNAIGSLWIYPMLAALAGLLVLVIRMSTYTALLLIGFLQALVIWGVLLPAYATARQEPVGIAAQMTLQLVAEEKRDVVSYFSTGANMPSFSVYRQAITPLVRPGKISEKMRPGVLVFTRVDQRRRLQRDYPSLGWKERWQDTQLVLLEATE